MKRPSFQFYPGDWQANSNLRRCTHEEKGIWIDVLCLLHDQEEYGVARWPLSEIAQAVGATVQKLRALASKGVLKGADNGQECAPLVYVPRSGRKSGPAVVLIEQQPGPVWYSSRMVEDEHKRVLRGESGATPKATPDHSPKGGFGATPKATPDHSPSRVHASSSSSSSASPKPLEDETHTVGEPDPPIRVLEPQLCPTSEGLVCRALKDAGIPNPNPGHQTLRELIASGADITEFQAAARDAVLKGKADFAYVIGIVRRRREEAAKLILHQGRMPNRQEAIEQANKAATAGWKPPELRENAA